MAKDTTKNPQNLRKPVNTKARIRKQYDARDTGSEVKWPAHNRPRVNIKNLTTRSASHCSFWIKKDPYLWLVSAQSRKQSGFSTGSNVGNAGHALTDECGSLLGIVFAIYLENYLISPLPPGFLYLGLFSHICIFSIKIRIQIQKIILVGKSGKGSKDS